MDRVGILSYELKNRFERLQSTNEAIIDCPHSVFFLPTLKMLHSDKNVQIFHEQPERIFAEIDAFKVPFLTTKIDSIRPLTSRNEYLKNVEKIKEHIIDGDIYEMNYCLAFEVGLTTFNPVHTYLSLMKQSPMPFSVFFKAGNQYVISASPERFLKKSGSRIIAQPIKGTIRRGDSAQEDEVLRQQLQHSEKERAENLMIVDLMRNDLARIATTGSVKVEELFGVYPFKRVSQMISTVSASLRPKLNFKDIVANTFPMGSMTGAPKIRCMELIDQYENFRRGWFSGSIGYISANGDFDFNVVIRSIIVDFSANKLFFAVGSAITYDADPAQEYEECLLKAMPIFDVLTAK